MTAPPPGGAGDRTDRPHPRDNGLAADHFVALVDVDPRIAVPLLDALRRAGIAAYVAPTPGTVGGYLDVRLPERPTDRLWVDGTRRADAGDVVRSELDARVDGDPADGADQCADEATPDTGAAFEPTVDPFDEIVAGFHNPWAADDATPWPEAENLPVEEASTTLPPSRVVRFSIERVSAQPDADAPTAADAYLDEHFVPEPPPPLPRPAIATFWALVGVIGGLTVLILAGILHWELDPVVQTAAGFGILGGFATLIWRMREAPGDDDDGDDGAVV
jgi:hypothetical protein